MSMMDINPKFKLAIVELYSPYRHGFHNEKNKHHVYGHHIINYSIDVDEFYNELPTLNNDLKYTNTMTIKSLDRIKYELSLDTIYHPIIRNYENIINNPKQYEIQIIEPVMVSVGDTVFDNYSAAIIKTHWLRLIQRKWREIRKKRIVNMSKLQNLQQREINGKFPNDCCIKFSLGLK
jgi:hypothetical protein